MIIKYIPRAFFLALVLAFSTACEEVIDIDLNESDPKLVVEAFLSNETGSAKVLLSRTVSYFEAEPIPAVTGATITISDDLGNTFPLTEIEPGVYVNDTLAGTPGLTYTLDVNTGAETVTATSFMPPRIPIDSITFTPIVNSFVTATLVEINLQDPAEAENYYRTQIDLNGNLDNDIDVYNDRAFNGNSTTFANFVQDPVTGDTVRMALWSIDRENYVYYNGLADNLGGGNAGSAAPGNPVSNLPIGVLGNFTTAAVDRMAVPLP